MGIPKDPCGFVCFMVTYSAILYADYCIIIEVLLPTLIDSLWGTFHVVAFNTFIFLMVLSHIKASFTDPGKVPLPKVAVDFSEARRGSRKKKKGKTNDEWTVCKYCEMFRPPRAHHCRVCKRCIRKMDHHCPWINNCVGERNQKYFILFLFYTVLSTVYAVSLGVGTWSYKTNGFTRTQIENRRLHIIVMFVVCVFFLLYVIWILYEQIYSVFHDTTMVEQVQNTEDMSRSPKSKVALLTEVFGAGSYIKWLLPWNTSNTIHSHEGYEIVRTV